MDFKITDIKLENKIIDSKWVKIAFIYAESVEENPISLRTAINTDRLDDKEHIKKLLKKEYDLIVPNLNNIQIGDVL